MLRIQAGRTGGGVADALRPMRGGVSIAALGLDGRYEPIVERQPGDRDRVGQREVAVPVVEVARRTACRQLRVLAEQRAESVVVEMDPDRARGGGGDVAVAAQPEDGNAVRLQLGDRAVELLLVGAVGLPQRALGIEVGQRRLPRRPVAVEQRRGVDVVVARQDQRHVERRIRAGAAERRAVGRRHRAVQVGIEMPADIVEKGRVLQGCHVPCYRMKDRSSDFDTGNAIRVRLRGPSGCPAGPRDEGRSCPCACRSRCRPRGGSSGSPCPRPGT